MLEDRPVRVELARDLPLLRLDPVLLAQVFINLLENAIKYTPPTSPLDLDAKAYADEIVIELRDAGPGLPRGSEQRIFEKFYRGAHLGIPGVGLGLAIAKGIVEAHGGTLQAENRPDGGARFEIRLPRARNVPDAALPDGAGEE